MAISLRSIFSQGVLLGSKKPWIFEEVVKEIRFETFLLVTHLDWVVAVVVPGNCCLVPMLFQSFAYFEPIIMLQFSPSEVGILACLEARFRHFDGDLSRWSRCYQPWSWIFELFFLSSFCCWDWRLSLNHLFWIFFELIDVILARGFGFWVGCLCDFALLLQGFGFLLPEKHWLLFRSLKIWDSTKGAFFELRLFLSRRMVAVGLVVHRAVVVQV